jgi:hypothetical protein
MIENSVQYKESTSRFPNGKNGYDDQNGHGYNNTNKQSNGDYLVYSQQTMEDINNQLNQTRSQRIRAAMFPETLEDTIDGNSNETETYSSLTAVQRLAKPSHLLKTAIMHLINYQEDAEVTVKALPELLKLLGDDDRNVQHKAALLVEQLSRKDASRLALTQSPPLIAALLSLITNSINDIELQRTAVSALHNICANGNKQALHIVFKSGGIPALVKMLGSPIESVVYYAITTLHSLLMYEEGAKVQVIIILKMKNDKKPFTPPLDKTTFRMALNFSKNTLYSMCDMI